MAEIFKIDDVEYEFECKLTNPDGQEVKFAKSAIRAMTLIDDIFSPLTSGTIAIANPYDMIEEKYFLRGDGRDKLYIMFKPKDGKGMVENTFVLVNDANTVNPLVRSENVKTFALMDANIVPFMDKVPNGKRFEGKIGKIIQDIFKDLLGEDVIDKDKWEEGDFTISYIPPATFRYIDLLRYLLRLFYAKDEEIYVKALLGRENKKYTLQLLSKVFADNDKNTIEAFALGDLTSKLDTSNDNNPPSGPPVKAFDSGLKNLGYSTPLYDWTKEYFLNSLVTGYDPIMGQSKIQKLEFSKVKDKWKNKFVDVFKSLGGKPKPFAMSNDTTDKRFKYYKFPYPVEDGVKLVEAEMYNNLTFLNLQMSFNKMGDTQRKAGKFIDIFTTSGSKPAKSDEKILGRWYVTEVRHIFSSNSYINEIYGVKTYVGPKAKYDEDVD